jgi:ATP-dependent exoDNAse (exonuclease V) beta subunit
VPPHEIAVIAPRNATADLFALHLAAAGVPTLRAGDVDLESRLSIRYLLSLMRAIGNPADLRSMRDALLAPWWQEDGKTLSLAERAVFLRQTRDSELRNELATTFPEIAKPLRICRSAR